MQKLKTISFSVFLSLGTSTLAAQNLPAGYEVTDLGALDTVSSVTPTSFGYDINNSGQAVGISEGRHTVENQSENGVIVIEDINVAQPVDFNDLTREIMPYDREFGFGSTATGMIGTSINEAGLISGFGVTSEEVFRFNNEAENEDDPVNCVQAEEPSLATRRLGFYFDAANTLTIIPNYTRPGLPLDEAEVEFTSSRVLDSNEDFLVGYASRVTEKDDCNNTSELSERGFIYDLNTESVTLLPTLIDAEDEDFTESESYINRINANGDFVGRAMARNDNDSLVFKGIMGHVSATEITEVPALEGATFVQLYGINETATTVVGASNIRSDLRASYGYYVDVETGTTTTLGFLKDSLKFSQAFDINTDNLIIGISQITSSPSTFAPFIYDMDAAEPIMTDLNTLIDCDSGWILGDVRAINDSGVIVGSGTFIDADGEPSVRAFKLTPRADAADRSCEEEEESDDSSGSFGWGLLVLGFALGRRRFRKA
ncbi:DUF3466 family protein [Pleionea sediminis]|uniref:DUF3466 family protein n=1 Tax=Pleionea sediminis TaxID=2569479 RepID=UPI0011861F90|nr:DUF3466 family protein [Pleionea sediminis]